MLTLFGKFSRKLRIDKGELLKHMADKLGVTPSFLSAVETGKKNVPQEWFGKIVNLYALDAETASLLNRAIEESQLTMKMDMKNFNNRDKNIAMSFAREFKELDEEEKSRIWEILQKGSRGGHN